MTDVKRRVALPDVVVYLLLDMFVILVLLTSGLHQFVDRRFQGEAPCQKIRCRIYEKRNKEICRDRRKDHKEGTLVRGREFYSQRLNLLRNKAGTSDGDTKEGYAEERATLSSGDVTKWVTHANLGRRFGSGGRRQGMLNVNWRSNKHTRQYVTRKAGFLWWGKGQGGNPHRVLKCLPSAPPSSAAGPGAVG